MVLFSQGGAGRFDIGLPGTRSGRDRGLPHLKLETISGRIPSPHDNLSTGTKDSATSLTTPDMVRSGRVPPKPQLNLHNPVEMFLLLL